MGRSPPVSRRSSKSRSDRSRSRRQTIPNPGLSGGTGWLGADSAGGLVGDRYYDGAGTFSNADARGVDLALIQQETIDNLLEVFPAYRAEDARRNIVTRGIALNHLAGWRFRVGEVECIGQRL